ncbi:MAG: OmpA family protein [Betaproteobacteria bacterium]
MPVRCAISAAQFDVADDREGRNARGRVTVFVALAALLISCAPLNPPPAPVREEMEVTRNDQVVLLPVADGSPGAVVVRQEQEGVEIVLDEPYASAVIEGPGRVRQFIEDPGVVRQTFTPTLAALPSKPASFLLYFPRGEDELTAESKMEVEKILAEMAKRPAAEISIIGHTDTVGSSQFNDKLSLQRAKHVRQLFVARGVAPGSIAIAGRGERELLLPTGDDVHEPRNRRVEIKVR